MQRNSSLKLVIMLISFPLIIIFMIGKLIIELCFACKVKSNFYKNSPQKNNFSTMNKLDYKKHRPDIKKINNTYFIKRRP
jgi:hypothetical protein